MGLDHLEIGGQELSPGIPHECQLPSQLTVCHLLTPWFHVIVKMEFRVELKLKFRHSDRDCEYPILTDIVSTKTCPSPRVIIMWEGQGWDDEGNDHLEGLENRSLREIRGSSAVTLSWTLKNG